MKCQTSFLVKERYLESNLNEESERLMVFNLLVDFRLSLAGICTTAAQTQTLRSRVPRFCVVLPTTPTYRSDWWEISHTARYTQCLWHSFLFFPQEINLILDQNQSLLSLLSHTIHLHALESQLDHHRLERIPAAT